MKRTNRNVAYVLAGLGYVLVFALGLFLGAKVERGVGDLKARQIAVVVTR